jgi:hypothetical protein
MAVDHEMHRARVKAVSSPKHPMEYNDGGAERANASREIAEYKARTGYDFRKDESYQRSQKSQKKWFAAERERRAVKK